MHRPNLPVPHKNRPLAFTNADSARAWLVSQAQTQNLPMLSALRQQIEAIDGANMQAALAIELLNLIRSAAVPLLETIEGRYTRKALPMQTEDQRSFVEVQQLWSQLGIAYLRRGLELPPAASLLPLNRAACAFRIAEYCHFQAARECPVALDQLLLMTLRATEKSGNLLQPLPDPDFPHFGEAHIAGHLAWAFLLRLIDPYRLTANQLIVANRAISRWRELCSFEFELDADPKSQAVDLGRLFGGSLPDDTPRWLNVRSLVRKSRQRIEALKNGQTTESLKLGRELSPAACIRLLNQLNDSLRPSPRLAPNEDGPLPISFGVEPAYAMFRGNFLNLTTDENKKSAALIHQRMEIFGFDRLSQMPTAVKTLNIPGETWQMLNGKAVRPLTQTSDRLLSPCLISGKLQDKPRLGVLHGLQTTISGNLAAHPLWYENRVEAGYLKQRESKIPAFLLLGDELPELLLPAHIGVQPGTLIVLAETSIKHLTPIEVLERGVDFVRYRCQKA